jgi:Bacterial Ig domain/Secretion system C-terminal sorting domain
MQATRYASIALFVFLFFTKNSHAQSWIELRERGANYYDVRTAFLNQYGSKMREATRELYKEVEKPSRKSDKFERELEGILQFMRWSQFVEPRVAESGGDINAIGKGIQNAMSAQSRNLGVRAGANWQLIGPVNTPTGGGNGRVNAIRVHPTNNSTLFACTPAGGLWKTTNGGTSWSPISDAIAVLGATDVAFDPANANTMYLVTGDGEAGDAFSTGVFKSTDGGSTWAATGLTFTVQNRRTLSKIIVNGTTIIAGGSAGIYRSINGGSTWTQVSTAAVRDLEFKPNTPSVVYAGGYNGNYFLRSTDNGVTWAAAGTGLPTTGVIRTSIAVTPLNSEYVYALVGNNSDYGFKGLYLSTDGGTNFTLKSSTPNVMGWNADGSDAGGQAWYDLALTVDPTNANTIYVGGVNIFKSTNAGTNWTCVAHWYGGGAPYVHADVHDLIFLGSTLYAGTDGGVFSTTNGGTSWANNSSNMSIAQIYSFGISQTNANLMISGHQDNGTNVTSNASTWSQNLGGDGMQCLIDRSNNNQMIGSIYYGSLYRSTNAGAGFSSIYTVAGGGWVTPIVQDPVTAATLYAGGANVVKSINFGTNWTTISAFSGVGTLVALDVATTNAQCILAASATRVMKTTNGGTTWAAVGTGLPTSGIQTVKFDPANANKIYVGVASYSGFSAYCSTDGGATWVNISTGLPSVPVNTFAVANNGDVYCGTDLGVYLRSNGATTWAAFTTGMPGVTVMDLKIYAATGELRAATYGRGIWKSPLNTFNNPPIVNITSPLNGTSVSVGAIVTITATASDADGTVSKVEFYNGATLISTKTAAPYTATLTASTAGIYNLTAKAYDNTNAVRTSSNVAITATVPLDAGISAVSMPVGNVNVATTTPSVILRNFGSTTITSATIQYRVDANAFSSFNWTGSLAGGSTVAVALPAITGYALGNHTFTAQTATVNGGTDSNAANNSAASSFTYVNCSNGNEPTNNSTSTPTTLTLNTTFNSQIGSSTDIDYYKFTTTTASPKIRVTLSNLPADYDIYLYNAKSNGAINTILVRGENGGTTTETLVYNTRTTGGIYYLKVNAYGGVFSTTQCYNLLVQTGATNFARSVQPDRNGNLRLEESAENTPLSIYPNPADDMVNIKFKAAETGTYKVSLVNMVGQVVLENDIEFEEGDNETTVKTVDFARGVYLLKVNRGSEKPFVEKLFIN